jgi:hypothetical protein
MNIADDMGLRLQNDVTTLDRTLDRSIHHNAFGCNDSVDMRSAGNNQGRAVDFDWPSKCVPCSRERDRPQDRGNHPPHGLRRLASTAGLAESGCVCRG